MHCSRATSLLAAAAFFATCGLVAVTPARAISNSTATTDNTYSFLAKINTDKIACSGALVTADWILTSARCFPDNPQGGTPATPASVTVGRTDLNGSAGRIVHIRTLVRRDDRDLVLAQLDSPIIDIAPVALATTVPASGESLRVAGYGRTSADWVPDKLHTSTFSVASSSATTLALTGDNGADTCKGDAGGPAFRDVAGRPELVGLTSTSRQHGCLAISATQQGSTDTRTDDIEVWITQVIAVADFGMTEDHVGIVLNSKAQIQNGGLFGSWTDEWPDNATKIDVAGTRIGVLTADRHLHVKDTATPNAPWTDQADNTTDFQLSANRIGIIRNGQAMMKDGGLFGSWTDEWPDNATKIGVAGTRIGVLTADRHLHVKDTATPNAPWTDQADNTTDFQLSANRIGIIRNGQAMMKDGGLFGSWTDEWPDNATKIGVAGTRIGVLTADRHLHVKDTATPNAPWTDQADNTTDFQLSANRIGIIRYGKLLIKEGNLFGSFITLA